MLVVACCSRLHSLDIVTDLRLLCFRMLSDFLLSNHEINTKRPLHLESFADRRPFVLHTPSSLLAGICRCIPCRTDGLAHYPFEISKFKPYQHIGLTTWCKQSVQWSNGFTESLPYTKLCEPKLVHQTFSLASVRAFLLLVVRVERTSVRVLRVARHENQIGSNKQATHKTRYFTIAINRTT